MTNQQLAKNNLGPCSPIMWNMITTQPTSIGQGTWAIAIVDNGPYNAVLFTTSGANGDNCSLDINVPKGTYTFTFNYSRAADRGIFELLVNGVSAGTVDMYGAPADMIGTISGLKLCGPQTLTFKVNGKNGGSGGYVININAMQLTRVSD